MAEPTSSYQQTVTTYVLQSTNLPTVLCHLVSLFAQDLVYVVGWSSGRFGADHVISYNPVNSVQREVITFPKLTHSFGSVMYHGQLFLLLKPPVDGPCELWSLAVHLESSWKLRGQLLRCSGFQVAVFREKFYMVGGRSEEIKVEDLNSVKYYNETTERWSSVASLRIPRSRHALVVLNDELYAIGGFQYGTYLQQVESYNGQHWVRRPDMLTPRISHTAVVLNNKIYVIGGFNGNNTLGTVECYNPTDKTWRLVASLNIARWGHAAAVVHGQIFVFGGNDINHLFTTTVECYDESQNLWTLMPNLLGVRGMGELSAITI